MLLTDLMPGDKIKFKESYSRCNGDIWKQFSGKIAIIKAIKDFGDDFTLRIFFDGVNCPQYYDIYKYRVISEAFEIIELAEDK